MEKNPRMDVIVVGGGIAGSTIALSLHQAGVKVRVYEAVRDMAPLGVGINLQPIAVRELVELGIGKELANAGNETHLLSYFNKLGQHIYTEKRGIEAGYNWPQYSIHRGMLQTLLLDAVRDRIGYQDVRNGLRFNSFEQNAEKVVATFLDTETGAPFVDHADILIGADGIHSAVRRHIHPSEGEPKFAGQVLWRAAVRLPLFGGPHNDNCRSFPPTSHRLSDLSHRCTQSLAHQLDLPNNRSGRISGARGLESDRAERKGVEAFWVMAISMVERTRFDRANS